MTRLLSHVCRSRWLPALFAAAGMVVWTQAMAQSIAASPVAPDPTVALVQQVMALGPSGVLLGAAWLLSRWQPTIVLQSGGPVVLSVRLDDHERGELAKLRRVAVRASGDAATDHGED